ncbi:hypothetical protein Scep_028318 [Stephania cephalantha]|uniref:Phytocyanin domain-containing protein n=1 Tax=Stephania cephalantha TaxID=152367 RepID=A0AAP0HLZ6_9MAGN
MEYFMKMIKSFMWSMLIISLYLWSSSQAYDFYVGGRDGWVLNPSENFNHWAERNRFQVNDTLIFKRGSNDSVLVVTKEGYDKCDTSSPLERIDGGDSKFKFDRSGPFFFTSGDQGNCEKGQKLIVVVLALRHHASSTPPAVSLPPLAATPPTGLAPATAPWTSLPPTTDGSTNHESAPAPSPSSSPLLALASHGYLLVLASTIVCLF